MQPPPFYIDCHMSWRSKSYEEVPALSVRGPELRRALRTTTIAWMYGVVWMSCVSGSNVKVFSRMLGFGEFTFGLLTAIPFIATFGQLLASVLIERTGLRKYQFLQCSSIHRLLWVAVAAIPLVLPVPSIWAVSAMLVVLAGSWFMNALGAPAWLTWMGNLIPRRIRGRYFANRFRYARGVQILVVVTLSLVLDWVTVRDAHGKIDESAAVQPVLLLTISGIFVVAAICGVIDILLFRRIREVVHTTSQDAQQPVVKIDVPRPSRWRPWAWPVYVGRCTGSLVYQLLLDPLKDRVFRHYVAYGATLTFAMAVPGWYFVRHCMEWYGFTNLGTNILYLVISPVLGLVGSQLWGRLLDRWGRRPTLVLSTTLTVFSVMPYFFATSTFPRVEFVVDAVNWIARTAGSLVGQPNWHWLSYDMPVGAYLMVMLSCIIGGIGWTGVNLGQTNVILSFADGHGRSKYVAASAVLISIGGVLGGIVGGVVAESLHFLQHDPIRVGPLAWNNWNVTFAISCLARIGALLWLVHMPDPGSGKVRDVIRLLTSNAFSNITGWVFYPLRIFGWGRGEGKGNNKD